MKISKMYETTHRVGAYMCDFCHEKPRKRRWKINRSGCQSLMFCSKQCKENYLKKGERKMQTEYKVIRRFKEDYNTFLKGQCIGVIKLDTKPGKMKVVFDQLEDDLSFITKIRDATFSTSGWAKMWNCTEEVKQDAID